MRRTAWKEKGQAIVLVTLALMSMCGLMGLAVDLGWSFFTRRSAQSAADAAASAVVGQVFNNLGGSFTFTCGVTVPCTGTYPSAPAVRCSSLTGNGPLQLGCNYASKQGYNDVGFQTGRQMVTIEATAPPGNCSNPGTPPTCIPHRPGVASNYYAAVRVYERIPQLFSAVLGNGTGEVSVRATASIVEMDFKGSLLLLNREWDINPADGGHGSNRLPTGMNFLADGGGTIDVPAGIILSSQCDGAIAGGVNCGNGNVEAGHIQGNTNVSTSFTFVRSSAGGAGVACAGNIAGCSQVGQSQWVAPYQNKPRPQLYDDPTRGLVQPPLPSQSDPNMGALHPALGGLIQGSNDPTNPTVLPPGHYYAADALGNATGVPLTISGNVQFGACHQFNNNNFVFWGGVSATSGNQVLKFGPGRHVFAGVQDNVNNDAVFRLDNGTSLTDCTGPPSANGGNPEPTDAGELFIFTDGATYTSGWMSNLANAPPNFQQMRSTLHFGNVQVKMGNNANSFINLHGLNGKHADIKNTVLDPYSPFIFWQDRRNSNVMYTPDGYYYNGHPQGTYTCGGGTIDDPCLSQGQSNDNPDRLMFFNSNANTRVWGAVYQPRGTTFFFGGSPGDVGPLQVVSGSLRVQGGGLLRLSGLSQPIQVTTVALVE